MNAIDIDCPECGAKAGERCHTRTGKAQPVSHAKRKHAAFEEEMRRETSEEATEVAGKPVPNKQAGCLRKVV